MAIVVFNYADWSAAYPELVVSEGAANSAFDRACLQLDNTEGSPVLYNPRPITERLTLLYLLTAHVVALGASARGGAPGRINTATQGGVTIGFTLDPSQGMAYFNQTTYGVEYWAATLKYRQARYYPARNRSFNLVMWGIVVKMAQVVGGDQFKANLAKLSQRLATGKSLRVGFLEGARYPDGTPVGYIAALNNYGHGGTPPRPFFSNMVNEESGGWGDALEAALQQTDNNTQDALSLLGEHIAGQIREAIIKTNDPPLSPVTVMLRHMRRQDPSLTVTGATVGEAAARVLRGETAGGTSTKPLVDTGDMLSAVDYEVSE